MKFYSTREAAKKLGIPPTTLATYIAVGKVPSPNAITTGKTTTQIWTDEEIEHVRQLLPKIANGRKTRWQKQKAQARAPVPHKKGQTKQKKKRS